MKYFILFMTLLLSAIAAPAFAGNECANTATKISNYKMRDVYIKDCLTRASAHENAESEAQKKKEAVCDQNVKNLKMEGDMKFAYLKHCYQENDFNPDEIPDPRGPGF